MWFEFGYFVNFFCSEVAEGVVLGWNRVKFYFPLPHRSLCDRVLLGKMRSSFSSKVHASDSLSDPFFLIFCFMTFYWVLWSERIFSAIPWWYHFILKYLITLKNKYVEPLSWAFTKVFRATKVSKCHRNNLFLPHLTEAASALESSGPILLTRLWLRTPGLEAGDRTAPSPLPFQASKWPLQQQTRII